MFLLLVLSAMLLATVSAWNTDVHQQIGFMAESFLTPETTSILRQILEPEYNGSIGRAAAWADAYAHTDEGAFSYQWHWIDSQDDPPSHCNVHYERDCAVGDCVVSAITNQTATLRRCIDQITSGSFRSGTNLTCSYALKWVTHFLGDITQPLHASGRAAGGNLVNVTFNNISTELHAVWDGYIIYSAAHVPSFSNTSISPFMTALLSRIQADSFMQPVAEWLACSNPRNAVECAMTWASESNAWTCKHVYKYLLKDADLLSSGYAASAYPIVEMQVSKAALRLGTWLNRLVADSLDADGQLISHRPQAVLASGS